MMEQIKEYDALSPLLAAQLRPGVLTNAVLRKADYLGEIQAGTLFAQSFPGGLLLLRQRGTHQILNFYLQKDAAPPEFRPQLPTVLEIAARPRDAALLASEALWKRLGFLPLFARQRMTRKAGTPVLHGSFPAAACVAPPEALLEAGGLLEDCFDPLTGCLPSRDGLLEDLRAGRVFMLDGGVLHMAEAASGTELRHLAVAPALRRQGAAQALFEAYMAHTQNRSSRVWVRRDNLPALSFYEKNGYTCDGWASVVYAAGKDL